MLSKNGMINCNPVEKDMAALAGGYHVIFVAGQRKTGE
jgi:hypothetical protein